MGNFVVSIRVTQETSSKLQIMNIILKPPIYIGNFLCFDHLNPESVGCLSQELYITSAQNCDIKVKQQ